MSVHDDDELDDQKKKTRPMVFKNITLPALDTRFVLEVSNYIAPSKAFLADILPHARPIHSGPIELEYGKLCDDSADPRNIQLLEQHGRRRCGVLPIPIACAIIERLAMRQSSGGEGPLSVWKPNLFYVALANKEKPELNEKLVLIVDWSTGYARWNLRYAPFTLDRNNRWGIGTHLFRLAI